MTLSSDIQIRKTKCIWFEDAALDSLGHPVGIHSVVTPIEVIHQNYAENEPPIVVQPGDRLLVLGIADGNRDFLWAEIDDKSLAFASADICVPASKVRNVYEVGEGSA
ncbi:hypothetical protein ATDW_27640 [Asticcacaulis sp. DW145]|jgi:hypothetical protein|uniref:Uncharacterized protein n=1 Tax=Asticcacaulis currens TaxID=2984210 RepID=A0ABT5IFQ9_9CAUL|nr:hypothetical protein [Asticcacaulis currens]MDC7695027.1 hypothetical protein [Asticcacaulis currens]BEV12268.1 hypothetical protein ATDW_27640 [Asticcacaulis sp. DW145]